MRIAGSPRITARKRKKALGHFIEDAVKYSELTNQLLFQFFCILANFSYGRRDQVHVISASQQQVLGKPYRLFITELFVLGALILGSVSLIIQSLSGIEFFEVRRVQHISQEISFVQFIIAS